MQIKRLEPSIKFDRTQSTLESVSLHWSTLATLSRRTHVRFNGGGRRWRLSSPEKRLRTEDTDGDPRPHRKESVKLVKITEIKVYPTWVGGRNQLIVKVETDEGIHGWGEAGVSGRELAVKGAVEHYREFLLGRDPRRPGALWQEMYRSQYFEGGRILTGAISAIDIALYDVHGKALGVPVHQLLGGKHRDFVPCFATAGAASQEQLIENAKLLLDKGWSVIRTGMAKRRDPEVADLFEPRESIGVTAEWLTALRQEIGPDPVLGVDYHHRLSVAETASFCQRMPPGTLDFLEEPIRDEIPEAYESLRTMVDIPFAIGEEFASKWQFAPHLERGSRSLPASMCATLVASPRV